MEEFTLNYYDKLHNEKIIVADNMIQYGGSFMKCWGETLLHADINNTRKIKETWAKEWQQYLGFYNCQENLVPHIYEFGSSRCIKCNKEWETK